MKICAVIPTHNHDKAIKEIVRVLCAEGLRVYIVDDGSSEPACSHLAALHNPSEGIFVYRHATNLGKGKAVLTGMRLALKDGFTHALQVDADGQHDLSVLSDFMRLSREFPQALICGAPVYDASVPLGRKIGRWITHVWVWIETLSFRITDSMCGFRIYPLAAVEELLKSESIGSYMDFDTDIIVRLFWRGVPPIMRPVGVIYPLNNHSNFDLVKDNWRITKMHTRLFLTLLARLPSILKHRPPQIGPKGNWASLSERGAYWGIRFSAFLCRSLGRTGRQVFLMPIVLYFYLTGSVQRQASLHFLEAALGRQVSWKDSLRHFLNFGMRALDVFMAWTGGIPKEIVEPTNAVILQKLKEDRRGGVIVVSHLGNVELVRALVDSSTRKRLTVLVHTKHAENYNRIICEGAQESALNVFQVTDIGPDLIIHLKQRVEEGGWIVIAGDRSPVMGKKHTVRVPFFGAPASFPQGPWILAALLECPVSLLFCLFDNGCYRLSWEPFADQIVLPRADRENAIRGYTERFAKRLEDYCKKDPYQWYNFYDFWDAS